MNSYCYYGIMFSLLVSGGYLTYLNASNDLGHYAHLRFWIFLSQHLFVVMMLIIKKIAEQSFDQFSVNVKWLTVLTSVNFLMFGITELYTITHQKEEQRYLIENVDESKAFLTFSILSYNRLYYNFNIYFGILTVFCIIVCVWLIIKERNNKNITKSVLKAMEERKVSAEGDKEICPICHLQYQREKEIYDLPCRHKFHKECLQSWIQNKPNCPVCRDDLSAYAVDLSSHGEGLESD